MDESLAIVAVDIGGRPFLKFDAEFKDKLVGDLETELIEDFFKGFSCFFRRGLGPSFCLNFGGVTS